LFNNLSEREEKKMKTFGQRFAELRKAKGYTQEQVAEKLGLSTQAISKWETDNSYPDISLLLSIAELLGTTVDELLGREKKPEVLSIEKPSKKDLAKMILRIRVLSEDGDKVNINLPLTLVRLMIEKGVDPSINGKDISSFINWDELLTLIEQGVLGKLVDIDTGDGDKVEIYVETLDQDVN
jgi:transcriptional regulator with XRE-family HTH domain